MEAPTIHHGAMFDTSELVLNMGPQHPSTHGVLRVVLRLDGEKVVDAEVVVGYLHRGIEKLSENRNWTQIILLTDRMDYVAAATSNVGYCETVEKLMSLEVPRRARYVRTILCELLRIASHCLWIGTHAMALGLSGPPLRGSGIPRDVRKDEPYAAYDEMQFDVPIGTNGDTYDRYLVRLEEFRQSLRIIRQATEGIPEGPIVGKVPRLIKPAAGETYHAIESPKGELGYFIVSDGKSTNPYRFRVRPPSFCNLQALPRLVRGHMVADVVALIGSIDIVLGEVDR